VFPVPLRACPASISITKLSRACFGFPRFFARSDLKSAEGGACWGGRPFPPTRDRGRKFGREKPPCRQLAQGHRLRAVNLCMAKSCDSRATSPATSRGFADLLDCLEPNAVHTSSAPVPVRAGHSSPASADLRRGRRLSTCSAELRRRAVCGGKLEAGFAHTQTGAHLLRWERNAQVGEISLRFSNTFQCAFDRSGHLHRPGKQTGRRPTLQGGHCTRQTASPALEDKRADSSCGQVWRRGWPKMELENRPPRRYVDPRRQDAFGKPERRQAVACLRSDRALRARRRAGFGKEAGAQ